MVRGSDCFWLCMASILMGFFFGGFTIKVGSGNVRERTMVEFNLAHYDGKTKEFVADSLEIRKDTIIIHKKD